METKEEINILKRIKWKAFGDKGEGGVEGGSIF